MPAGDSIAEVEGDREELDRGRTSQPPLSASFGHLTEPPNSGGRPLFCFKSL